jgi:hypothetical protein
MIDVSSETRRSTSKKACAFCGRLATDELASRLAEGFTACRRAERE